MLRHLTKIALLAMPFAASLLTTSCKDEPEPQDDWVLVWNDEFNTPTTDNLPNPNKWSFETGATGNGNNELQIYTKRPENIGYTTYKGEGCMRFTALNDNYKGYAYSSARIKTDGHFAQAYGRFEARIQIPYGPGVWPAFWMLGANYDKVGWPRCGEIDIMENRGWQPNLISGSLHFPGRSGGNPITQNWGYENQRFDTDFHVYAVEWDALKIDFYVDNVLYQRVYANADNGGEWVFDHPFFLILNLAVGGDFVGYPTNGTKWPQNMYVDYVRVYKRHSQLKPGDLSSEGNIEDWQHNDGGTVNPDADKKN